MNKSIARELAEKNGVDTEQLVDLLVRTAVAELSNYYHYTLLRLNLVGVEGEALKRIIEDARQEDLNHFQALLPRIYELGGSLPIHPAELNFAADATIGKAVESADVRSILETLLKAAEYSVRSYTQICNMTCGKDNRTYGLALAILHEEIEHQVWFLEFFGHTHGANLGDRSVRQNRGRSPFVSKFLQSLRGAREAAVVTELPVERRSQARLDRHYS